MVVPSLSAEIGFGRQMDEQHGDRAANSARAMTTATDIVGEEYFAAATPVLLPVAGFNFEGARKHEEKLPPGSGGPVLSQAFGHFRYHHPLRRQYSATTPALTHASVAP